jgi:death-on-curing protein
LGDVIEAHRIAILRSGGLDGVRDLGLLESAIGRPYSGYYRTIHAKAAALTQSLSKNHGFIDGNKRATLLTLSLFLERSGYELVEELARNKQDSELSTNVEIEPMILDVVEDRMSYADLVKWFRARLRRRE